MDFLTILGLSAAVCTTASYLPQAIKIIRTKDTKDISLFMYILLILGGALWLVYGIKTKSSPIIVSNAISVVFALIITFLKIRDLRHKQETS